MCYVVKYKGYISLARGVKEDFLKKVASAIQI